MQKPLAYANDLADHDIIEDDSELVFGPHPSKLPAATAGPAPPARQQQLGGSSFKTQHQDTSILGSAPLIAKLAQSLSVPSQPMLAPRLPARDGHVYAGGNPIISAAPASRPSSAAPPRQPRKSAPSGAMAIAAASAEAAAGCAAASKSVPGGETAASATRLDGGGEPRTRGDIQGGDREANASSSNGGGGGGSTRPKSGLLRRLSSLTSLSRPASRQTSDRPEGAEGAGAAASSSAAPWATAKGADAAAATGPAPFPGAQVIPVRGSAIPCVDVQGERGHLLRKLSLRETPAARESAGGVVRDAATAAAAAAAAGAVPACLGREPSTSPPSVPGLAATTEPSSVPAAPDAAPSGKATGASAPPERPSTPLRRLTRLLSGSLLAPAPATVTPSTAATPPSAAPAWSDQRDQDGAGAGKGRISSTGVRELFSRPSSARRKSETGSRGSSQQVPLEAWKHSRPVLPVEISDDGPADDRVQEFGAVVVRQPSGMFKRAANALAAALTAK